MKNIKLEQLPKIDDPSPFDLLDCIVFITNPDTFKLLFANKFFLRLFKTESIENKTCYEVFSGNDKPCEHCPLNRMTSTRIYKGTTYNKKLHMILLNEDQFINYKGSLARLEVGKDISKDYSSNITIGKFLKRDKLLNSLSNTFLKTSGFSESMLHTTKSIGEFFSADRCYIYFIKNNILTNDFHWADENKGVKDEQLSDIDMSAVPYWKTTLNSGKSIFYKNIESISLQRPKEYDICKKNGIKSLVVTPILFEKNLVGVIGLNNPIVDKFANVQGNLQTAANYISLCYQNEQKRIAIEYDSLTGLPNFDKFRIDLVSYLKNNAKKKYYLIKLDINRFEFINSYFGSHFGDEVLKTIGRAIKNEMSHVVLATRLYSSDIFFLLVEGSVDHGKQVIRLFLSQANKYFFNEKITLSFGIYKIDDHNESFYTMVDKVALAHRKAKLQGDNRIYVYEEGLRAQEINEQKVVSSFQKAINEEQFIIYIQPIYGVINKTIASGEVLVRWIKDGVLIPPNDFIPILEKNGMIATLDRYVFSHAVKYLSEQINSGNKVVPLSVNLSRISVQGSKAASFILETLNKYSIPKGLIEVEITESAFVQSEAVVSNFVKTMQDNEIPVLMDDFGSGYSSLNSFKNLDISILKMDYKFLAKDGNEYKKMKTIESILVLAKSLDIPVIAEGVEKQEEADMLEELGVSRIQGFLYARPMPYKDFSQLDLDKKIQHKPIMFISDLYKELMNVSSPLANYFNTSLVKAGLYKYSDGNMTLIYKNSGLTDSLKIMDEEENFNLNMNNSTYLNPEDQKKVREYMDSVVEQNQTPPYIDYTFNDTSHRSYKTRTKAILLTRGTKEAILLVESIRIDS